METAGKAVDAAGVVVISGTTPAELLSAADQALYRAKREGRDRTVVHRAAAAH
jgi:PleD family two-component response regulator